MGRNANGIFSEGRVVKRCGSVVVFEWGVTNRAWGDGNCFMSTSCLEIVCGSGK